MVNNPNSVPPSGQNPNSPEPPKTTHKNTGQFQFSKPHTFLNMRFTAQEWSKLMNIFLNNLSSYMNQVFQKMTEKMKKDWRRGAGEDVDD